MRVHPVGSERPEQGLGFDLRGAGTSVVRKGRVLGAHADLEAGRGPQANGPAGKVSSGLAL